MADQQDQQPELLTIHIDMEATRRKVMQFVMDKEKTVLFSGFIVSDALQFLLDREVKTARVHSRGHIWLIQHIGQEEKGET